MGPTLLKRKGKFYVYVYLDPRKPGKYVYGDYSFDYEPFYIGKGKDKRCRDCINSRSFYFLNKVNKIKKAGFFPLIVKVAKEINEKEVFEIERKMILLLGRKDLKTGCLINLTDGGEGLSGHFHSEETKRKMSVIQKGKKLTEKHKMKISMAHKGKKLSEEAKTKISIAHKGKNRLPFSKETKRKMFIANKGKKLSTETKEKMSIAGGKRTHSEETKRKMSKSKKGLKLSKNFSVARINYYNRGK